MTQALFADPCFKPSRNNEAPNIGHPHAVVQTPDLRNIGRQSIRSIISAARPLMPNDASRHSKLLMAQKIWSQSEPISLTLAETYLALRHITFADGTPMEVRFHGNVLFEPTREHLPAMIAPMHNLEGAFVGIHKTYLTPDGSRKAKYCGDKGRFLGQCHGSYVQLCKATSYRLVVAESIETGLQILQACPELPVWSAITVGNMRARLPDAIKELIFYPDTDKQNPDASRRLLLDAARDHMSRQITVKIARTFSSPTCVAPNSPGHPTPASLPRPLPPASNPSSTTCCARSEA